MLSDTHGWVDPLWDPHLEECDEIWHAGDFGGLGVAQHLEKFAPLRGVFGNIDGPEVQQLYPEHLRFSVEGVRVWMTHIGGQPKRYPKAIKVGLQSDRPDLFICGHSHILRVEKDAYGVLHLNPGACGRQGFHLAKTLLRLELLAGQIKALQIVELGPR